MAMQYRYNIEARYPYKNGELIIPFSNFKNVIIYYDYDKLNMPILLAKMVLDKNVIDDMIENSKTKYITLKITKFIKDSKPEIDQVYIYNQFTYYLDNNTVNKRKELDYGESNKEREDIYEEVTIGLSLQSLVDYNKTISDGIHNNETILEILLCYLTNRKILIEPPTNKKIYNAIIPTISTFSQLIKYIDSQYSIYDTQYRYFNDYDKTYLVSSSGKGVPSINEAYNTIIINVNKTSSLQAKNLGIELDKDNKSYIIDIDTTDIELYKNDIVPKTYGKIIGVDNNGNTTEEEINIEGSNINNVRIERTNDLSQIKKLKHSIESNDLVVNITRTELDTSIFTINKEIYIKNYDKLQNKESKFIIMNKKEIFIKDSSNFVLSLLLTLKKINS